MRLINVHTLELEYFADIHQADISYAILSHRWEHEEVLYQDMLDIADRTQVEMRHGYKKIKMCCEMAARDNLRYAWVDTCCIDKSSSAELQEAINSMFVWYSSATVCYAFLSDVGISSNTNFKESLWFTRGWTLQELLAPSSVIFFDSTWTELGSRSDLTTEISYATSISRTILESGLPKERRPCVAEMMSWARNRRTTRMEDRAYSLLGLFGVSMPLLYGEGVRAFQRLQEEILRNSDDQSIFAWSGIQNGNPSLLAQSPDQFPNLAEVMQISNELARRKPHSITNEGITLEFEIAPFSPDVFYACLNVEGLSHSRREDPRSKIAILVRRIDDDGRYARIPGSYIKTSVEHLTIYGKMLAEPTFYFPDLVQVKKILLPSFEKRQITVVKELKGQEITRYDLRPPIAFRISLDSSPTNHWTNLVNDACVNVLECDYNTNTRTMTGRPGNYGSLGIIEITQRKPPLSLFPLRWIALGFDLDFSPVIVLKAGAWDSDCYRLMRSSGPFILPSPSSPQRTSLFSVDEIHNGNGGVFSDDVVAIKRNVIAQNDSESVDLQVKMQVFMPDDGIALMTILMSRPAPTEPWQLYVKLEHARDITDSLPTITVEEVDVPEYDVFGNNSTWDMPVWKAGPGSLPVGKRKRIVFEDERRIGPNRIRA